MEEKRYNVLNYIPGNDIFGYDQNSNVFYKIKCNVCCRYINKQITAQFSAKTNYLALVVNV